MRLYYRQNSQALAALGWDYPCVLIYELGGMLLHEDCRKDHLCIRNRAFFVHDGSNCAYRFETSKQ